MNVEHCLNLLNKIEKQPELLDELLSSVLALWSQGVYDSTTVYNNTLLAGIESALLSVKKLGASFGKEQIGVIRKCLECISKPVVTAEECNSHSLLLIDVGFSPLACLNGWNPGETEWDSEDD